MAERGSMLAGEPGGAAAMRLCGGNAGDGCKQYDFWRLTGLFASPTDVLAPAAQSDKDRFFEQQHVGMVQKGARSFSLETAADSSGPAGRRAVIKNPLVSTTNRLGSNRNGQQGPKTRSQSAAMPSEYTCVGANNRRRISQHAVVVQRHVLSHCSLLRPNSAPVCVCMTCAALVALLLLRRSRAARMVRVRHVWCCSINHTWPPLRCRVFKSRRKNCLGEVSTSKAERANAASGWSFRHRHERQDDSAWRAPRPAAQHHYRLQSPRVSATRKQPTRISSRSPKDRPDDPVSLHHVEGACKHVDVRRGEDPPQHDPGEV